MHSRNEPQAVPPPGEPQRHSQDAEREGTRHALAVSDQEAAITACPGQQLLGSSAAQVSVVPGGGRAAQRAPRPGAPWARRPTRRGHGPRRAQRRPCPPPGAIPPARWRLRIGQVLGSGPEARRTGPSRGSRLRAPPRRPPGSPRNRRRLQRRPQLEEKEKFVQKRRGRGRRRRAQSRRPAPSSSARPTARTAPAPISSRRC